MQKFLLVLTVIIGLSCFGIKLKYDRYTETHMKSDIIVYYAPGDATVHIDPHCRNLHLEGQQLQQTTYGKAVLSHYTDNLCTICVPQKNVK